MEKNLKNNKTEEAVSDFEQLTLYSNIAIENADKNHNVNAKKLEKTEQVEKQMNEAAKNLDFENCLFYYCKAIGSWG